MEQNNTQSPPAAISKARCVFLGFLVVGLIVFIVWFCMANYNVSIDYRVETGELSNPTIISEKKSETEIESGFIGVKDNILNGLLGEELASDADSSNRVVRKIEETDSSAVLALWMFVLAIVGIVGVIAIDVVQVFVHKDNKILKAVKLVCFLLFLAAAATAVITYATSISSLYYTLRNALSKDIGKDMRLVADPHVGASIATTFGIIGVGLVIIGFIAIPLARAYKKQYGKKHNS